MGIPCDRGPVTHGTKRCPDCHCTDLNISLRKWFWMCFCNSYATDLSLRHLKQQSSFSDKVKKFFLNLTGKAQLKFELELI